MSFKLKIACSYINNRFLYGKYGVIFQKKNVNKQTITNNPFYYCYQLQVINVFLNKEMMNP